MILRNGRARVLSSHGGWGTAQTHASIPRARWSSTTSTPTPGDPRARSRFWRYGGSVAMMTLGGAALAMSTVSADPPQASQLKPASSTSFTSSPVLSIQVASKAELARSYFVYTLCSIPLLIDYAPSFLYTFTHTPVPGLKSSTEYFVRHTFFRQFVPGETVAECRPTMEGLRSRDVGTVLNYSAEVAEDGGREGTNRLERERLEEVERALDEAGAFERQVEENGGKRGSTAFALKITGLIDPDILARASTTLLRLRPLTTSNSPSSPNAPPLPRVPYPGAPLSSDRQIVAREVGSMGDTATLGVMNLKGDLASMGVLDSDEGIRREDLEELAVLWTKLKSLGERARKNGVNLMIDAEHTWYQPALDAYTLLLSEEFNRPPKREKGDGEWTRTLIFGTYQSYLTREPALLLTAIRHAEKHGFALGIKLVRGAYFVQERSKWKKDGREGPDPIWPDKPATDLAYNTGISTIISALDAQLAKRPELALSVVFGTHNPESVSRVINELRAHGLAKDMGSGRLTLREDVRGKVFIAQLYGMKDDLMDKVVEAFEPSTMPVSLKYVAYGRLAEVMPFLGRRAIENKSVMSGEGGAGAERSRVWNEVWRRLKG